MSKIFKSPYVSVGKPVEVTMNDSEFIHTRLTVNEERSSDFRTDDPNETASLIIEDANFQAREIIERANFEAENIISSAQIDADTLRLNASEKGYEEGYQRGLIEGKMETEELAHQALTIKQELEEEKENLVRDLELKAADLIMQCVNKIINCEMKTTNEVILGVISGALNKIVSGEVVVRVSESDFCFVEENKNIIASKCKDISSIDIKKDLSLEKGDCVIETQYGIVDAGIDTQLQKLNETINEVMGNDNDAKNC